MPKSMTKAELTQALISLGETPPKSWTVRELELRLQELKQEMGMVKEPTSVKNRTPLRQMQWTSTEPAGKRQT